MNICIITMQYGNTLSILKQEIQLSAFDKIIQSTYPK